MVVYSKVLTAERGWHKEIEKEKERKKEGTEKDSKE